MKRVVFLSTTVDAAVTVDIPDDTPEGDIERVAIEEAFEVFPASVCAQCSGWGQPWSIELGEFDPIDKNPVVLP